MTSTASERTGGAEQADAAGFVAGAIDSDVHPSYRDGVADLAPYVGDAAMRRLMGFTGPGAPLQIPFINAYRNVGGGLRVDATPPAGGPPASDPDFVVKDLLDRYELGIAVLRGGGIAGLGGMPNPDIAAAFASAHNQWMEDVWLAADPRFRASLVVAPQDPALAVAEVERWADHAGVVSVWIPPYDRHLFGDRHFWPIYEAATHYGLPVDTHPGGESAGMNSAMVAVGAPSTYIELHSSLSQVYQAHVVSLVLQGVFEQFPTLRFGMIETGFAWVPHVMWRMDKNWKSLREEVPWVKRPPSEYIIDHIRFTTQPLYEPSDPEHLRQILRMIHAERTVMFSTDYPHWDADEPAYAYRPIPDDLRRRFAHDTPRDFYRLQPRDR